MEFTAVILCGEGHGLMPFSVLGNSGIPKALIPVANKPMLAHVLDWCERAYFKKSLVVVSTATEVEIKTYVEDVYLKNKSGEPSKMIVELVSRDLKASGEIVASLAPQIPGQFIVLPCDFVTDVEPETLLNIYRLRDKNVVMTGVYYKNNIETIDKKMLNADIVVHSPSKRGTATFLDSYTKQYVQEKKSLELRMALLWHFPNPVASTEIHNSSIFICSAKVLEILTSTVDDDSDGDETAVSGPISPLNKSWGKVVREFGRRSWRHRKPLELVAMSIIPDDKTFIRANNLSAYLEANRYIMKLAARNSSSSSNNSGAKGGPQISADSLVSTDSQVGDRTNIKKTVIGSNCKIGNKCRLIGCVVFDNVTIENDTTLENCIIGRNATIRHKSKLSSCNIEGGYTVNAQTEAKNEVIKNISLEDVDSFTDSEDGSSDEEDGENWSQSEGEDIDEDDDGLFDRS